MEVKTKQTPNVVDIIGRVKENKIQVEPEKIGGSVVIQYGEKSDEQVEVNIFVPVKKKDGTHNAKYDKMVALKNNIVTIAESVVGVDAVVATETTEAVKAVVAKPATVLSAWGNAPFSPNISLNEYCKNGVVLSTPRAELGFGNLNPIDRKPKDFKGEFAMTVFLTKNPIMKEDVLEVEALYINYRDEVKPVTFVVKDSELIDGIEGCLKGETVEFWGNVKIANITQTKKTASGFGGKAKTDTKVISTSELLITGGNPVDEESPSAINPKFIKVALVERETFLEELKKKEGAPKKSAPKGTGGFGGGSGFDGGSGSVADDDDIPF